MTINLNTQELVDDIFAKSHHETALIENVEQRYEVEAGTDRKDDVARCLTEANAILSAMCSRFMTCDYTDTASNLMDIPDVFCYSFKASERRFMNKTQALADVMHSLIVNLTLSKYYNNVSHGDLAQKRDNLAKGDMALLERLLYEKTAPTPPTDI